MFTIVERRKDLRSIEPDYWSVYRDDVDEGGWVADFSTRESAELFVSVRGGNSGIDGGEILRYVVEPCVQEGPGEDDYAILENDQGATFWLMHCYDAAGDWHWTQRYESRAEVDDALSRVRRTTMDEMEIAEREEFIRGVSVAESLLRMVVFGSNKVGLVTTEVLLNHALDDLERVSQLLEKVVQRSIDSENQA